MEKKKPYVVSKDKSGAWYCHRRGYPYIPVVGSIGDKAKAMEICRMYNKSYKGIGENDDSTLLIRTVRDVQE